MDGIASPFDIENDGHGTQYIDNGKKDNKSTGEFYEIEIHVVNCYRVLTTSALSLIRFFSERFFSDLRVFPRPVQNYKKYSLNENAACCNNRQGKDEEINIHPASSFAGYAYLFRVVRHQKPNPIFQNSEPCLPGEAEAISYFCKSLVRGDVPH